MEDRVSGKPRLTREEKAMMARYTRMSDEELLDFIRARTKELGRPPTKNDVSCSFYFKQRLGPWNRILEQAGMKEVSARRQQKLKARQAKRSRQRQKAAEQK
ncbi:MAG: homing endonuclease associated repeat-containing protein [Anaerovoracaceae bacterium]